MPDDLCDLTATELTRRLRTGDVSSQEVVGAHLDRIDGMNGVVNAVVSVRPRDEVLAAAAAADDLRASGDTLGPLHGLPVAVKDLADVMGLPTRLGSPVTPPVPAAVDSLFVERLRAAGVVIVGKTNTPEMGAGSHTFNPVFGVTRNPWDPGRSAGGSSGGAAAALASGMVPVADGSDLGGSLRNPAAFCGVVGLRPSIGRVPTRHDRSAFLSRLGVEGPMARTVEDAALLLSVVAGPHPADPLSRAEPGASFWPVRPAALDGLVVGWGGDLGLPVDAEVLDTCAAFVSAVEGAGARVVDGAPDLTGAMDAFRVFRAFAFLDLGVRYGRRVAEFKAALRDNIGAGEELTPADLWRAERTRTRLHAEVVDWFGHHDVLLVPATQVMPFPVDDEYPTEVAGQVMDDYLEWMSICCVLTPTGCPSLWLPAGVGPSGLPVGVQVVGRPGGDADLLAVAAALEAVSPFAGRRPDLAPLAGAEAA